MSDLGATDVEAGFDNDALRRRSAVGAAVTLVAQGVKFVLRFGSTVVMARLLAPAEFGLVAMVSPIVAFAVALNDVGFSQAIIRDHALPPKQISSLFWLSLLVSAGLAAVLLVASPVAALVYREPHVTAVLAAMTGWLLLSTLSMVPLAILAREMRFVSATVADLAGIALGIGATIWAAWAGFSYWSLVIGQVVGAGATAVLAFALSRWRPSLPGIAPGTGEIARFGANLTGVSVAGYVSMTADNIIVGAFAGKVALGLYDRSYGLVLQPLNQLLAPLNRVALPLLSRVRDDPARYRRIYVQMLKLSLLLTAPVMLFCVTFAHPFIQFLWGPRWTNAAPIFFWFSVGGIVSPIFTTTGWLFASEGRTNRQFRLSVATALISLASFVIGIRWGAIGVVRLNAFTFILLQTPLMVWGAARNGLVTLRDFAGALLPLLIPAAVTTAALLALSGHLTGWLTLAALFAAYAVFGLVSLAMPGGRDLLATTWRLVTSLNGGTKRA
ncbi:lipopolysaccharide biosynthesis protein [Phenylobacterium sp.]|uniref:lipopolysaccharide biosynthesis protein n=1 Tax=Phenylobacterium sp. TaxID=1871053 RepID=UPI0035659EE5